MDYELAGLRKALKDAASLPRPALAERGGAAAGLHVVGIGGGKAAESVRRLLAPRGPGPAVAARPPGPLLLLGFAGAVDAALRSGDLVLSSRYYREDPDGDGPGDYLSPDAGLWAHAVGAAEEAGLAPTYTDSLTVDRLVSSGEEKRQTARRHPVGIVNMEDYWIAAAAREAGAAFLSARVVLDAAHQTLPRYLLDLGGSRAGVAVATAARPWRIPTLLWLARQARPAQRVLTGFALSFMERLQAVELVVQGGPDLALGAGRTGAAGRRETDSRGRGRR